jgi:outer membrane protein OmpA-like peptidoglycan-associated protein
MLFAQIRRFAVLLVVTFISPSVRAQGALEVRWVSQVKMGQVPKLIVTARDPVERVEVLLNREDGTVISEKLGNLGDNGWREIALDGSLGRHSYSGRVSCVTGGRPFYTEVSFETYVSGSISLVVPRPKVEDLMSGRLEIRTGISEGKAELHMTSAVDVTDVTTHTQSFTAHDPAQPLILNFKPATKGALPAKVEIRVTDPTGTYQSLAFSPWMITIPHEEVVFATDSAVITSTEAPKLTASLKLINEALKKNPGVIPKLFIAGHTDTVGAVPYNLSLSRKRAQAIAGWFRKNGLAIAIASEGFGEHALRVTTPDNTEEARNRRVDYILSVEEPALNATDFRPVWKPVK